MQMPRRQIAVIVVDRGDHGDDDVVVVGRRR